MKIKNQLAFLNLLWFCYFIISCSVNDKPLFTLIKNSGIEFNNLNEFKTDYNIFNYRNYYNGGGVAIGDLDNDGLPEVFFSANQIDNALYWNKGNFRFENITEKAGLSKNNKPIWSTGVSFVDVNNDGWLDIYICNAGNIFDSNLRANQLFINNHDLSFTEMASKYGLDHKYYSTQANFFDYDLDGDLDCFFVDNSPIPVNTINNINARHIRAENSPVDEVLRYGGDHLFKNENGKFIEVSEQAGIHGSLISLGLGATVSDLNQDGWPDIYVSNDFFERDYLYINQRNGTFKDEIENYTQHQSLASMGADIADINNDGQTDIFTTDMLPKDNYRLKTTTSFDNYDVYNLKLNNGFYHQFMQNTLQLNTGNNRFIEMAQYAGVEATDWSWGALLFDADNDGFNDIYVCNGIKQDLTDQDFLNYFANDIIHNMVVSGKKEEVKTIIDKMPSTPIPNIFFKNNKDFTFTNNSEKWGTQFSSFSNGAAYADLDNDGDLDLIVNNINQKAFVFKNNSELKKNKHFIQFKFYQESLNHFAVGTKVYVYTPQSVQVKELFPTRGFQSAVDYKLHFGLDNKTIIDSVIIIKPDLSSLKLTQLTIDSCYTFTFSRPNYLGKNVIKTSINSILTEEKPIFKAISENNHVDFYLEKDLPKLLSREGPKACLADLNLDGLMDIYISGTNAEPGLLYLQKTSGKFVLQPSLYQPNTNNKFTEETAVCFFDANNDNYPDLFIAPGGNTFTKTSDLLNFKLFFNDHFGNFIISKDKLPQNDNDNIAFIQPLDYDNDGDLDLFIGGRSKIYNYGITPNSYLLNNLGNGKFIDRTSEDAPELRNLGLLTAAFWGKLLNKENNQLIIVGEWMSPKIFEFKKNKALEVKNNLTHYLGWWQTVKVADMNNDNLPDLVLGNIGENCYLKPNQNEPVKLWILDFDNNNTVEKILTRTIQNKDYTILLKREFDQQLPFLKKQNLNFKDFASKTIQDLFGNDIIKNAQIKTFNFCSSIIAYNDGNGNFNIKKLPPEIQFSAVNDFILTDVNKDNLLDIICAGNRLNFLPQFGRLDGSYGILALNKGQENFIVLNPQQSGLDIIGQVSQILPMNISHTPTFIFLRNNQVPIIYKSNLYEVKSQ